ncbi:FKBP-type peptidyl-prolyl cis-trans isomerase [Parafrigoribacterium soli]|uniref:FKBP-type peptidyl-prolyl cis-trans isomerase n=1 Tax=Parafrigoribacterium soli TaxID=3144663 RepID=UPI0032F08075
MRKTLALIATLGVLTALTACSGGGAQGCDNPMVSGAASSVVKATGAVGSAPKIDFPTPITSKTTQKTELIKGKGAELQPGQPVLFEATLLNGADGKVIDKTGYTEGAKNLLTLGQPDLSALSHGLECSRVGSRVVIATSDKAGAKTGGVKADGKPGSVIFVADITKAFLTKANGAPQASQSGMPEVVLAPNGRPGITVPQHSAPKKLKVNVLKAGDGKKITEGDTVVMKYTGVVWDDASSVFDSTWTKNQAVMIKVAKDTVVAGFVKGLVGQKVGSQVLLVIPPKEGYGAKGQGEVPANATIIFVVDILGISN